MNTGFVDFSLSFIRRLEVITDFPTPVSPVTNIGLEILRSDSQITEYLVVSIVGTKRLK